LAVTGTAFPSIRHNLIPLRMSIAVLDESEALIHYVQPDTLDLTSSTDIAISTRNSESVRDLRHIFDLM
jgi:hypothetical protein